MISDPVPERSTRHRSSGLDVISSPPTLPTPPAHRHRKMFPLKITNQPATPRQPPFFSLRISLLALAGDNCDLTPSFVRCFSCGQAEREGRKKGGRVGREQGREVGREEGGRADPEELSGLPWGGGSRGGRGSLGGSAAFSASTSSLAPSALANATEMPNTRVSVCFVRVRWSGWLEASRRTETRARCEFRVRKAAKAERTVPPSSFGCHLRTNSARLLQKRSHQKAGRQLKSS